MEDAVLCLQTHSSDGFQFCSTFQHLLANSLSKWTLSACPQKTLPSSRELPLSELLQKNSLQTQIPSQQTTFRNKRLAKAAVVTSHDFSASTCSNKQSVEFEDS